jgi:hypothetical protein
MSLQQNNIKKCCASSPVWIFVYSDGRIFSICNEDYKSTAYRFDVTEVINIETKVSMTPKQAFGDSNGNF